MLTIVEKLNLAFLWNQIKLIIIVNDCRCCWILSDFDAFNMSLMMLLPYLGPCDDVIFYF